jgi:hypothetical protein
MPAKNSLCRRSIDPGSANSESVIGIDTRDRGHREYDGGDSTLPYGIRWRTPTPTSNTAYDALMLGGADECADDALAVVLAARPGFLPEQVLAEFE